MNHDSYCSRKPKPVRWLGIVPAAAAAAALMSAQTVQAAEEMASAPSVSAVSQEELDAMPLSSADEIIQQMVANGKIDLNIRARVENADQDGLDSSTAWTERTRLGFTTGTYNGVSVHAAFEDTRAASYDKYNAAGLNDQPGKTVIADPENTELDQLYVNFDLPDYDSNVRVGRQVVNLDDQRFVGNVGWRQNEQTFDAVVLASQCTENITGIYGYVWHINTIYGQDSDRDLDTSTHLLNVSYHDQDFGKLTGFAYLLDVTDSQSLSSQTYGVRYVNKWPVKGDPEGAGIKVALSYAHQSDYADNPTSYDADYFLADAKYVDEGWYLGAGYELLGSDNGNASFQTPLATTHRFNGWADVFTTTPNDGLEDTYVYLGGDLPLDFKGKVVYHWFDPNHGGMDLGEEFDAQITKKLTNNADLLFAYATYNGDDPAYMDVDKFWAQLTLHY